MAQANLRGDGTCVYCHRAGADPQYCGYCKSGRVRNFTRHNYGVPGGPNRVKYIETAMQCPHCRGTGNCPDYPAQGSVAAQHALVRALTAAGVDVYLHRGPESGRITAIEARGTANRLVSTQNILAALMFLTGIEVEQQVEDEIILPNDGYSDGGEPYTEEELSSF